MYQGHVSGSTVVWVLAVAVGVACSDGVYWHRHYICDWSGPSSTLVRDFWHSISVSAHMAAGITPACHIGSGTFLPPLDCMLTRGALGGGKPYGRICVFRWDAAAFLLLEGLLL